MLNTFKKYIKEENFEFEFIDSMWDCSIEFDIKMLDELGIKYKDTKFDSIIAVNNNELIHLYKAENNMVWLWAITQKPYYKAKRKVQIDDYKLFDSETAGNFEIAYPKITKALKEYINPILEKVASNTDFT